MNAHPRHRSHHGLPLLSNGFRPFFLLGSIYAGLAILIWLPVFMGELTLTTAFAPRDWHVHEMLYGYLPAVITGFLFTAIPNWTGRLPIQGTPLLAVVVLWLAGRVCVTGFLLDAASAFGLIPAYIAYYTIFPRAIGGRLYSDAMARIAFILFVVVAMPIGVHHLFADPQVGAGFKFIQSAFTALVALPTLVTVFTICASAELAGRLRGGKGPFGWVAALPWGNPMMLAVTFSFVMLGFGVAGGLINM